MSATWPRRRSERSSGPQVTGPINIGTGVETTVVALFEIAARGLRRHGRGATRPRAARRAAPEPARRPQRARQLLGWTPRVGLDEGLRRTVAAVARRRLVRPHRNAARSAKSATEGCERSAGVGAHPIRSIRQQMSIVRADAMSSARVKRVLILKAGGTGPQP